MRRSRTLAALALGAAAGSAACAARPEPTGFAMRYEQGWSENRLEALLARAGTGDVAIAELGRTAWVSHHLAVIRTEEQPHYHRFHDLTVLVVRGEGTLFADQRQIALRAGDVAHLHRGTPHFFRRTGKEPAVAFVVFSPPFDGRDRIPLAEEKRGAAAGDTAEEETEATGAKKGGRAGGWWPF